MHEAGGACRRGPSGAARLRHPLARTQLFELRTGLYPYTPHERAIVRHVRGRTVVGTADQVRDRLTALAAEYGADELVVVTITHDPKARLCSYELLAGAFELEPREDIQP